MSGDRAQHFIQLQAGGDRPTRLKQDGQFSEPGLLGLKQACIFDGDASVIGHVLQEAKIILRKRVNLVTAQLENSDH